MQYQTNVRTHFIMVCVSLLTLFLTQPAILGNAEYRRKMRKNTKHKNFCKNELNETSFFSEALERRNLYENVHGYVFPPQEKSDIYTIDSR